MWQGPESEARSGIINKNSSLGLFHYTEENRQRMLNEPSHRPGSAKYPWSHGALYLNGIVRLGPRSRPNSFEQRAVDVDRRIFLMGDRDRSPERRKDELGEIFRATALVGVGGNRARHGYRRGPFPACGHDRLLFVLRRGRSHIQPSWAKIT